MAIEYAKCDRYGRFKVADLKEGAILDRENTGLGVIWPPELIFRMGGRLKVGRLPKRVKPNFERDGNVTSLKSCFSLYETEEEFEERLAHGEYLLECIDLKKSDQEVIVCQFYYPFQEDPKAIVRCGDDEVWLYREKKEYHSLDYVTQELLESDPTSERAQHVVNQYSERLAALRKLGVICQNI